MTAPGVEARDHYASVDGLRAFAVAAVLLYHHDTSWLPGWYLGVEVFFVISGFIITSQLQRAESQGGQLGPEQRMAIARDAVENCDVPF